jgi:hypothetical protein
MILANVVITVDNYPPEQYSHFTICLKCARLISEALTENKIDKLYNMSAIDIIIGIMKGYFDYELQDDGFLIIPKKPIEGTV